MPQSLKEHCLLEMEIVINVFTVTFDQFNVFLLIKIIIIIIV